MRAVCKFWKIQCEYQVYLLAKSLDQKINIKIGEKGNIRSIDMSLCNYDSENQVLEFKSSLNQENVYMDLSSSTRTQITFSEWSERCLPQGYLRGLNLTDRAQVMFHLQYNPSLEQVYRISAPGDNDGKLQYLGDCGMVMSYSYMHPTRQEGTVVPESQGSDNTTSIRLQVHSVHVNFSWLLSGMNDKITVQPIYANRYQALSDRLNRERIKKYSLYSQYALGYIMADDPVFVSPITDEIQESQLEKLQSKLKSVGVDPRVVWKYTFAKNFILKNQFIEFDDITKVIQKSEEDWIIRRLEL